jgi:hypothetical protein
MARVAKTKKENVMGRGSEKLLKAWQSRALTEESIKEIAGALEKSPARVENVTVAGGENATGVQLSLAYEGDDGPRCGNDIQFWLQWLRKHGGGGVIVPPRIIINGTPWPELVTLELNFGQVNTATHAAPVSAASAGVAGE